jgi:hypothetical protein
MMEKTRASGGLFFVIVANLCILHCNSPDLSSGASQSANDRAHASNKCAVEMRVLAVHESFCLCE